MLVLEISQEKCAKQIKNDALDLVTVLLFFREISERLHNLMTDILRLKTHNSEEVRKLWDVNLEL